MNKYILTMFLSLSVIFVAYAMDLDTSLRDAVKSDDIATVQKLVNLVANINAKNINGDAPLHIAVDNGKAEIARLLIDHGANVNKNNDGNAPLHNAALRGNAEIVQLLINAGANVNMQQNPHTEK